MMTPQEAANSTFPKANFGGYNMAAVDVFLDKLIEDYTTLYKDNAALKAKMKVLVDKMEEYHAMEDTMRSTLLTAQKMANSMVAEAEQKSAALVADGEKSVRRRIAELQNEAAEEEQRLASVRAEIDKKIEAEQGRLTAAQQELQDFLMSYRKLCEKQLEFIERLPELRILPDNFTTPPPVVTETPPVPVQTAPVIVPPTVEKQPAPMPVAEDTDALPIEPVEIGNASDLMKSMQNVINVFSHSEGPRDDTPAEKAASSDHEDTPLEDTPLEDTLDFESTVVSGTAQDDPFADEDEEDEEDISATRVLNLDDLQFGRNYTRG